MRVVESFAGQASDFNPRRVYHFVSAISEGTIQQWML